MSHISQDIVSELIVDCIDQSLSSLETFPALLVYSIAQQSFGVSREEIPEKPEAFEEALEGVFGTRAALIEMDMTKLIVESFHLCEDLKFHALPELISEIVTSTNNVGEYPEFET
jgi:hypothetical protein